MEKCFDALISKSVGCKLPWMFANSPLCSGQDTEKLQKFKTFSKNEKDFIGRCNRSCPENCYKETFSVSLMAEMPIRAYT